MSSKTLKSFKSMKTIKSEKSTKSFKLTDKGNSPMSKAARKMDRA